MEGMGGILVGSAALVTSPRGSSAARRRLTTKAHPRVSGYTRTVGFSWRRGVSVIVLSAFAGLPVSALICAIDCAAEARPISHHASPATCHDVPGASSTIEGTSDHDCEHADLAAAVFLTAVRADTTVPSVKHAIVATPRETLALLAGSAQPRSGAPPGSAAPARPPLVLRI